jgi:hypothetical protein
VCTESTGEHGGCEKHPASLAGRRAQANANHRRLEHFYEPGHGVDTIIGLLPIIFKPTF